MNATHSTNTRSASMLAVRPLPSHSAPRTRPRVRLPLPVWAVRWAVVLLAAGCGPTLGTPPTTCSTSAVNAGESPLMEPGGDCMDCHAANRGPGFTFAGTVMNGLKDDQNCQGVSGLTVRITDATGKTVDMPTNSSGNFYSTVAKNTLAFPYLAEVITNGKTSRMLTPRSADETDCASCHSAAGLNGAPGRILAP